ncbi:uncharacterized protein LOC107224323 isoform X1 [Neodiprion lecontei]|uniref:Odorant receptor n=2 Tax=Neodiprion lecontei TaxID=441921 RepID=A0ABM3FYV6_NEOLC|nr:uncharacterized protein LOC107224323 isoform X1 [Neodiprion lecontei]XP_046593210.1 uncharacterized protein LOC107224323 isoform X1 [Neodiprion lecontei]
MYLSLETTIRFVKTSTRLMFGWPLPLGTKRIIILRRRILRILSTANIIIIVSAQIFNIYRNREDRLNLFLCMTEMTALSGTMAFVFICHIDEDRLRALITEMTTFVRNATDQELAVIRFYVKKCSLLHVTVIAVIVLGGIVYLMTPFVLPQPLPIKAAYPFSMEPIWIWALLYGSHVFTAFQVASALCMSLIFAVLTWFAAARFDIVNTEIERASKLNEVNRCVLYHQESLKFASRLSKTAGRMALAVAASNFAAVMFGGVVITFRQFYTLDFVKVVAFELIAMVHLFLYAWPADYMAQLSQRLSESVLHGQWLGKSPKMQRSVVMMMQRANDPVIIKIDGLLPALNLETFGAGLSTSFSYIATLLAIFGE